MTIESIYFKIATTKTKILVEGYGVIWCCWGVGVGVRGGVGGFVWEFVSRT